MTTLVQYPITALEEYRQCLTPEPPPEDRHWLLDSPAGRDALKAMYLREFPGARLNLWGSASGEDAILDPLIDTLGLREAPQPLGLWEKFKSEARLTILMLKLLVGKA